jgi:hypothetical protein
MNYCIHASWKQVCELAIQSTFNDDSSAVVTDCTCRSVHTFYSGATQKLLARSRLFISPAGDLLACAGDEASLSVTVDISSSLLCRVNEIATLQAQVCAQFRTVLSSVGDENWLYVVIQVLRRRPLAIR